MKVSPRADYPVGVRAMRWEVPPEIADLYDGIFEVSLNSVIGVVFVPDLSAVAPPFDDNQLPRDLDTVTTVQQARLAAILFARYAVTPNDRLSGTQQRLPHPVPADSLDPIPGGTVFFIPSQDFATYTAELAELGRDPGTVSTLHTSAAINFLQTTVVLSPHFSPTDLAILRDPTN